MKVGATQVAPESSRRPQLSELAAYFLWLGTSGFGGPIVLAARMQRDLVERKNWITADEYLEGLAFAQVAPARWPRNWRCIWDT